MTTIRLTGIGGQGVLTAGDIIIKAHLKSGGYGVKSSTYSSQVRGGPTKVDIMLSSEPILYPYALEGDVDIMLSVGQKSFDSFKSDIKKEGIMIIDPDLVTKQSNMPECNSIYEIPIIAIARHDVGNVITQSVVALGLLARFMNYENIDALISEMVGAVPAKLVAINKEAFGIGYKKAEEFL